MESLFYACPNLNIFQTLKFASDETNTEYFTYDSTTIVFGEPDVKWNQICFVFDNDSPLIYAKGKIFYNFNDLKELIEGKIGDLGNKIEAQEAIYYTQEEANAYNEEHELQEGDDGFITTSSIKISAIEAVPYTNIMEVILDNEEVIANALNTLNDQLSYINTNKIDSSNVYTKTEIDDKIANIDLSLYATTSEVNNKIGYLGNKVEAQEAIYYTQEEADAYNTKYNLDSGDSTYVTTESIINPAIEAVPYSNIMDVINDHKLMMVLNLSELSANKEDKINKTINISYNSTDDQYPSAKAVYTYVGNVIANIPIGNNTNKEDISNKVIYIDANSTYTQYPSAKAVYTYVGNAGFLTEHQSISGKEDTSNKVTSITSESTNTQYPSALAVYTYVGNAGFLTEHQSISGKESTSNKVTSITSESTNTQYPSAAAVYSYVGTAMANIPTGNDTNKEDVSNKVTYIDANSTNTQYPSAYAVYNIIKDNELITASALNDLNTRLLNSESTSNKVTYIDANSTNTQYPSAYAVHSYVSNAINNLLNSSESSLAALTQLAEELENGSSAANIPTGNDTSKENISNKVTYIDANSTDDQYPSAKAVYTYIGSAGFLTDHQDISGKESTSNKVTTITSESTNTQYPSAAAVYAYVGTAMTNVPIIWIGTQLQYDAITTKDSSTMYTIQ